MTQESDPTNTDLPLVRVATVCDRVLLEKDETISLIRLVDKILISAEAPAGTRLPEPLLVPRVPLTLFLSTVAGSARGERTIGVRLVHEGGKTATGPTTVITYGEAAHVRNWIIRLGFQLTETGLYWVEWLCNGAVLTRLPLSIEYSLTQRTDAPAEH